jgi:hypothetical protein
VRIIIGGGLGLVAFLCFAVIRATFTMLIVCDDMLPAQLTVMNPVELPVIKTFEALICASQLTAMQMS